jgi:DNA mismatch repair ATPase MutS
MCKELDKILKKCQEDIGEQHHLAFEVLMSQCLFDEKFEQADKFLGLLDCYISVALARENLQLNYPTSDLSAPQTYIGVRDLMVDYLPQHQAFIPLDCHTM